MRNRMFVIATLVFAAVAGLPRPGLAESYDQERAILAEFIDHGNVITSLLEDHRRQDCEFYANEDKVSCEQAFTEAIITANTLGDLADKAILWLDLDEAALVALAQKTVEINALLESGLVESIRSDLDQYWSTVKDDIVLNDEGVLVVKNVAPQRD